MSPSGQDATRVRLHPLVRELAREEWAQQPETTRRAALAGLLAGVHGWVTEHAHSYDLLARDEELIARALHLAAREQIHLPVVISTFMTFDTYLFIRNAQLWEDLGKLTLA